MSVLSGYGKYKRYVLTDTGYKLCSQWTSSNTVHFDDGKTAQTKLGAISGITDSLTATSSNVALSAKAGKSLQDQVTSLNTGIGGCMKIDDRYIALMGTTVDGITSYPTKAGIYRVTATKPSELPTDAAAYGTLIIMGAGYYINLYVDANNHAWITKTTAGSGGELNINKPTPTAWRKITA